jgi:F0F1-type ATP synthase membrane subunit c/vacuolar-type H+-ATPase subunit K
MIEDPLQRQAGQKQRSGPFSAGHSAIALSAVATAAMIDAALAAVAAAATGLAVGIVVAAIVAVAAETSTDQALHKLVQTPRSSRDFGQESRTDHDHVWGPRAGAHSVDCQSDAESADEQCLAASTDVVDPDA